MKTKPLTFLLVFLPIFWYSYKKSKRFRISLKTAFITAVIILSPIKAEANSGGADAFTPITPTHRLKQPEDSGLFCTNNNDGSGNPGSNGGNDPDPDPSPTFRQQRPQEEYPWWACPETDGQSDSSDSDDEELEIVYRTSENPALNRIAKKLKQPIAKSCDGLIKKRADGNRNPGIGTKHLFSDVYELRGRDGARVYYRQVDGKLEILGKSDKHDQQRAINAIKDHYDY